MVLFGLQGVICKLCYCQHGKTWLIWVGGGWLGCMGWREQAPGFGLLCWLLFLCTVVLWPFVLIVCLGSYQALYPLETRQDRSLCQHSQHIQSRMRNVSSSQKNSTTVYFTVSCFVLRLLHAQSDVFVALYNVHYGRASAILQLPWDLLKVE